MIQKNAQQTLNPNHMRKHLTILTLLLLTIHGAMSQKVKAPKDINEAITFLMADCSDSLKTIIKQTENDKLIDLCYPWNGDYKTIFNWTERDNKKSIIKKLLIKQGISYNQHQQTVILIAFKNYLNGKVINENEIFKPYQIIEKKWEEEDKARFTTDSIRGVYIPKDLDDCFKQIDSFWSDSTKMMVKQWTEEEFSGRVHHGFGMWLRNNWQLWGGSRLSNYFNIKGIYHPDDMSGIILDSYHRYLTGKEIHLDLQVEYYQAYWKVNKEPDKSIYPKGVKNLEFNTSQTYRLKRGNIPGCVHIQSNSKTDKVWIYDFHFGWKQLSEIELKELESSNQDSREDILRKLFNLEK